MKMYSGKKYLPAFLASLAIAGIAQAAPLSGVADSNNNGHIDLADVIATGATGFSINDKFFNNFSYTPSGATAPAASDIVVNDISSGGNEAIQFQFNFSSTNGTNIDSRIDYAVTVTDPNPAVLIDGVNLDFQGSATGSAIGDVAETIQDGNGNFLGLISVSTAGSSSDNLLLIPGQKKLLIDKDIQLFSSPSSTDSPNNTVSISVVDNGYHQTPEPASAALLGMAGIAAMLRRRRA